MIKTRLMKLLSHAKKYIVFQVVWKWIFLICQVVMIYAASILLENVLFCTITKNQVLSHGTVVLAFVNLKASLVLLICVPLIPISIVAVQKFAKKLLNKYWGIYTELRDSFLENLQGLTTLKEISMDFGGGSFISLVGTSGCGKSTIAGILMGRNKGYRGSIRIQGKELRNISEKSLMDHITLVSHNSYLFKGSVRDNLKMGKADASDEQENWNCKSISS